MLSGSRPNRGVARYSNNPPWCGSLPCWANATEAKSSAIHIGGLCIFRMPSCLLSQEYRELRVSGGKSQYRSRLGEIPQFPHNGCGRLLEISTLIVRHLAQIRYGSPFGPRSGALSDRKSTRLNSSH